MVTPMLRQGLLADQYEPKTTERKRSPTGISVVSPTSSTADTPSTIGQITPTRRMLFERMMTPRDARGFQRSVGAKGGKDESRQDAEVLDLRNSVQRKDQQLRVFHQRFHHIQQGLESIDQERSVLVERGKQLEKEKRQLQQQLDLREKEILALVKRCASQEEKMKESSRLRAENRELCHALETVQNQLCNTDQEREDLASLRKKLQESELAREALQERLGRVQREHDCIAHTLQECLARIRQLTEEMEKLEDERRRERKRAEIELEKQRLEHFQAANNLKNDLESKQLKIDQMEKILQENMYTKNNLRREHAISQEESRAAIASYEKKIAELQEELDKRVEDGEDNYDEILELLHKKIEEKDAIVLRLECEFSGQMGMLMRTQSSLDEVEEEKKCLEERVQELEKLETDHSAFVEYVKILESNLADLTNENAHLIIGKDTLVEEIENLQGKIEELGYQVHQQHQLRKAKEEDFHDLLEAEKEELRQELEKSVTEAQNQVSLLQSDLASRNRWISKLEEELKLSRKALLKQEEQILCLHHGKNATTGPLECSVDEATKENARLQAELETRTTAFQRKLDENSSALESLQQELERQKNLNSVLKLEVEEASVVLLSHEKRIQELQQALSEKEEAMMKLQTQLSSYSAEVTRLENQVVQTTATSKSLERQLQMALQSVVEKEAIVNNAKAAIDTKATQLSSIEAELDVVRKDKLTAEEKLLACEERISVLEARVASNDAAGAAMVESMKQSDDELAFVAAEKKSLQEKIDSLEKELSRNKQSSEGQYREMEAQYADLCKSLEQKQATINSLEASLLAKKEEVECIQSQLCSSRNEMIVLMKQIESKDDRILQLEKEVNALSDDQASKIVNLEKEQSDLESELQISKMRTSELTECLEEKDLLLRALDQRLLQSEEYQSTTDQRAREASNRCVELEEQVKHLNALLEGKEGQLQEFGSKLNAAEEVIAAKEADEKKLKDTVSSLEATLQETRHATDGVTTSLESELANERARHSKAREELCTVAVSLEEAKDRALFYERQAREQEEKIKSLQTELTETAQSSLKESQEKEDHFKAELSKLETQVALKNDEIRELRVIELSDKEDTIKQLSETLQKVKYDAEANEVEMTRLTNELKRANKKLLAQIDDQDFENTVTKERHDQQIATLQKNLHDMKAAKEEADSQIEARDDIISELRQGEQVLLTSIEQLSKSDSSLREEVDKLKAALDISILRTKEDLELQRVEIETMSRVERDNLTSELRSVEKKLDETTRVLNERSTLLGDMVEHNRDLESKLDKLQVRFTTTEEEFSRCQKELADTQSELTRAKEDACARENALKAKLTEERTHRDNVERSLAKLSVQHKDATQARKIAADLEKENATLKHKISRQEAYLQRKLQKEKIQRGGRNTPNSGAQSPVGKGAATSSSNSSMVLETPPSKLVRPSPHRGLSSAHGSKIPSSDLSQRSSRSTAGSSLHFPRAHSGIPFIHKARSADDSSTKNDEQQRTSSAFEPIQRDLWDLDVE